MPWIVHKPFIYVLFQTGYHGALADFSTHCVSGDDNELLILPFLSSKFWDHRHIPPCLHPLNWRTCTDKGPYKAMTGTSGVLSILPVRIRRRKFLGTMKRTAMWWRWQVAGREVVPLSPGLGLLIGCTFSGWAGTLVEEFSCVAVRFTL